jgi:hypothetical protein
MTRLSTDTRVRADADGRLTAECRRCRIHLEQLPGVNVERALAAFDATHTGAEDVPHDVGVPRGWRRAAPS